MGLGTRGRMLAIKVARAVLGVDGMGSDAGWGLVVRAAALGFGVGDGVGCAYG